MKSRVILAALAASLVAAGWVSSASAAAKATPVEYRACHFRDGKTMEDLDKVTAKFRDYAKKADSGYAAWTVRL